MGYFENCFSDRQLVDTCLTQDGAAEAWHQMFVRFHGYLVAIVRHELQGEGASPDHVDEVVQELWITLFTNRQILSWWDDKRGSLRTFLAALARRRARWAFLRRLRIQHREIPLSEAHMVMMTTNEIPERLLKNEFLAGLTPSELDFFTNDLHGQPSRPRSANYRYVLLRRILRKWNVYFEEQGWGE